MTKVPIEKTNSDKENLWNELNGSNSKFKNRRTLSFLNSNRRRISQFGTLKKNFKNRRLSLSHPKKLVQITNVDKETSHQLLTFTSTKSQLKKYADEIKSKDFLNENPNTKKKLSFKSSKQKHAPTDLNLETIFLYDKPLSEYLKNHLNSKNALQVM